MGKTSKGTAARVQVPLNGKTWTVFPLTFEDFGEYEGWAERQSMRVILAALSDLDDEMRRTVGTDAIGAAAKGPEASRAMFATVQGQAFLSWLSLRKGIDGLSLGDVYLAFSSRDDLETVVDAALEMSVPEGSEGKGAKSPRPF